MKSLDTYIQEKRADFDTKFREQNVEHYIRGKRMDTFHVISTKKELKDFLEATIRQTAREMLEAVLPEEKKQTPDTILGSKSDDFIWIDGYKSCRTAILSAAKERGIL